MSSPVGRFTVGTCRLISSIDPCLRAVGIDIALYICGQHKVEGLGPLILNQLAIRSRCNQFPVGEVQGFQGQLREIEATMVDGKFLAEDSTTPAEQHLATELLERCLKWSEIVLAR